MQTKFKKRGPGFNAVFGNFATMIGQILLIFVYNWVIFLLVLYIAFSCSFFSTVAYVSITIRSVKILLAFVNPANNGFFPLLLVIMTDADADTDNASFAKG